VSFIRHEKIYRYDRHGEVGQTTNLPGDHRFDESSAGYSFVGCSPAVPTSASPAANSFSLYPAAVQFSAANRNLSPNPRVSTEGSTSKCRPISSPALWPMTVHAMVRIRNQNQEKVPMNLAS
jgi:hypothetical protein